ncbi:hypothetical protein DL546_005657 [Coniochaeta pulveracea]|uniref:Uncharacterized protein n=1 Tax=Coniochaeta pulveracea TaxID=177199 RepID=A0A420Y2V2_9PEZI|nr:hypothetical protein DL546_005657 [Coniochaeta pulveracea]
MLVDTRSFDPRCRMFQNQHLFRVASPRRYRRLKAAPWFPWDVPHVLPPHCNYSLFPLVWGQAKSFASVSSGTTSAILSLRFVAFSLQIVTYFTFSHTHNTSTGPKSDEIVN